MKSVRSVQRDAFTLIELLVVIAIIAVLATIGISVIGRGIEGAKRAQCMGNLRTIYTYLQAYAAENNGRMPVPPKTFQNAAVTDLLQSLSPYIQSKGDRKVFYCPSHKRNDGSLYTYTDTRWNTGGISYHYYSRSNNSDRIPLRMTDDSKHLLMSDKFNKTAANPAPVDSSTKQVVTHPDGLNLMRLNGSIEFSKYGVDIRTW
jgi:prepilin-type N-terminal cleavage/methylation domain-containing protein